MYEWQRTHGRSAGEEMQMFMFPDSRGLVAFVCAVFAANA